MVDRVVRPQNIICMKKLLFLVLTSVIVCCISTVFASKSECKINSSEQYDCKRCNGTGIDPLVKDCPYCKRGRVQHIRDCERCKGSGYTIDRFGDKVKCSNCDGTGKKYVDEECANCHGTFTVKMKCMNCHGSGKVTR